jgi:hypothetical protein
MCANSTSRTQTFLLASDAAVSQKAANGKITIQSACALNTRYNKMLTRSTKWESLVGTLVCYRLDNQESRVRFPGGAQDLSILHCVQISYEANLALHLISSGGSFPGGQVTEE